MNLAIVDGWDVGYVHPNLALAISNTPHATLILVRVCVCVTSKRIPVPYDTIRWPIGEGTGQYFQCRGRLAREGQ